MSEKTGLKTLTRLGSNHTFDSQNEITFLNTEAFTTYMSKNDPEEIKPIIFQADKVLSQGAGIIWLRDKKQKLVIVTDLG